MEQYILPVMLTALLSVSGSYFIFSRRAITRKEHEQICSGQQAVTNAQLAGLQVMMKEVKEDVKMVVQHLLKKGGPGS